MHTDCLLRCFKHNKQDGKKLVCPLCRTKWDDNAIEYLQERTRKWVKPREAAEMVDEPGLQAILQQF